MKLVRLLPLLVALCASACGDDKPTAPSPTVPTAVMNVYTGTLSPRTPFFYAFSPTDSGSVSVTYIGAVDSTGATVDAAVTIGLGIPKGTGCGTTQTAVATPGLNAQLKGPVGAGTYCIDIVDNGSLTSDVTFTVRLIYSIDPTVVGSAGTETFSSTMTIGGSATRTFRATANGSVSVKLQGVSSSVPIGLGLGIPGVDGLGCFFSKAIRANAGDQISMGADAGIYCVKVYDVGNLTTTSTFNVEIVHP
jgi:hypothetical protein